MYQRVVIVGNLGRDPELRYTANGTPVANFPVATNRRWSDGEGTVNEETTWFRVSVFGRQAEICNQYLEKGRSVLCDGEIRTSQYEDQAGVTRYSWELRANIVKFLGGAGESGAVPDFDEGGEPAGGMGGGGARGGRSARTGGGQDLAEEDIPF
ncbi:MAG: single-stranded DNA-binding protein [Caldilineae bacterium]|nr:single-stranded DNA-binding protein [Chloroflexota bacterium]MCB9177717.1 single-stranded DNA-binding protein [Caldilineae bacterium]